MPPRSRFYFSLFIKNCLRKRSFIEILKQVTKIQPEAVSFIRINKQSIINPVILNKIRQLKRTGNPEDIAEIALALIKSNYINGEVIVVDESLNNIIKFDPIIRCVSKDGKYFTLLLTYHTKNQCSLDEVVVCEVNNGLVSGMKTIYDLAQTKKAHNL